MDSCLFPLSPSMSGDLEPSPMEHEHWIKWHAWYVDTPSWWYIQEAVSNLDDPWEFAQRVGASFKVPKVQCCVLSVENDHSALPAPKCLRRDWFLPLPDPWVGSQDNWMLQPKKTLAYMRTLQHWAEVAQLPIPGKPHYVVEIVLELQWAMELLTTFSHSEVLDDSPSSRLADPIPCECSLTCQACPRGFFSVACNRGCPGSHASCTTQMTVLATPSREAVPYQTVPTSQPSMHPPGFAMSMKEPPLVTTLPTPSPKVEMQTLIQAHGSSEICPPWPRHWAALPP